jgi:hypothetical protein
LNLTRNEVIDALKKIKLKESIRGEALSLLEFASLANEIKR